MNRKEAMRRIKEAKQYVGGKRKYSAHGSYPLALISYGEVFCVECARDNWSATVENMLHFDATWLPQHPLEVLWEGEQYCAGCGEQLEVAYPDAGVNVAD